MTKETQNKNCNYKGELHMRQNSQRSSLPHKENTYAKSYFPTDSQWSVELWVLEMQIVFYNYKCLLYL